MNALEIIAVIFCFASVIFTVRKSVFCWYAGILGSGLYVFILLNQHFYAGTFMQLIFVFQCIVGIMNWRHNTSKNDKLIIESFDGHGLFKFFLLSCVLCVVVSFFLINFSDDKYPVIDGVASSLALAANYALSKRFLQNWFFWIISDFLFVFLFLIDHMYLSAGLYMCLMGIATYGYFTWLEDYKLQFEK